MTLLKKKDDLLYWSLVALILYMPFHYYLCELLISFTNIDNIVRDGVILFLTALVFFKRESFTKLQCILVTASGIMLAGLGLTSAILNRCFPILNILRTYLIPLLIFFVSRSVSMTKERFSRLNLFLFAELAIVAIYGFFQAFFLTDDFLIALGYPNDGEYLDYTFYISYYWGHQRALGTFVSANICGVILSIGLCALLYTDRSHSFRWYYIWGLLLMIGLVTTFSRSSWLGFAGATGFCLLLRKSWTRLSKKTIKRAGILVLTAGILLLLDWVVFDSLVLKMFLSQTLRTFTGTDPSANAHADHLLTPPELPLFPEQTDGSLPLWLTQFGKNGPMAAEFIANPTKVESSYYLMCYEVGIVGTLIYFAPYINTIVQTIRNRKAYPYFVPAAVVITVLVSYVFLPNVQTFEIPFYCFMFMGLYENASVRALYQTDPTFQEDQTI